MPTQNEINVILRFLVDKTSQAAASGAIKNLAGVDINRAAFSAALYQLQRVGQMAFSTIKAAERFFGDTDPVMREWSDTQKDIDESWARIGRVMAEEMLPAMQEIARLAERVADLVEARPAAGGLFNAGAAAGLAGVTALTAGASVPVAGAIAGGVGQAGVGFALGNEMPPWFRPIAQGLLSTNPLTGMIAQGINLSTIVDNLKELMGVSEDAGRATGVTANMVDLYAKAQEAAGEATRKYAEKRSELEQNYEERRAEIVDEYGRRMADLEQNYMQERAQIIQDYNRERARAAADFEREQARAQADFEREQARAEADYVRQVQDMNESLAERLADITSQSNDAVEQMRKDHQERLEELERDHLLRVEDLVAARDAVGLALEERRYEMERQSADDDLQERIADQRQQAQEMRQQALQDYQQQLADLQEQHALERQRRQEDFDLRQAQAEEDYKIEQERRAEQFKQRLEELDANHAQELQQLQDQHRRELQQLQEQHRQKLNELRREYDRERYERNNALRVQMQELLGIEQQGHTAMLTATQAYVDSLLAEAARLDGVAGASGTRQSGGYVSYGNWLLHDNEFVLSPSTTAQMEAMLGARLNQSNVLAGMAGKRVTYGGAMQTINVNMSLPGGTMSLHQQKKIIAASKEAALSAFADVLENL